MADTVYRIKLDYVADTTGARAGVEGLATKMISLNDVMEIFRKGWNLVESAVRPMLEVNKELEMAKIRIAGIANATEGWTGGISRGMAEASGLIKGFTADAAASVATTTDFVNIGARLAPVLLPAGKSMRDLRDVTKAVVDGASSLGIKLGIAGDQLSRMIMGQAGMDLVTFTTLFASEMNKFGKDFTRSFNEMTQSKRLESILEKLDKFKAAGSEIEASFTGVTSTLEDVFELTLADVGKPLFEAIKLEIKEWLIWIEENDKAIKEFGRSVGTALVDSFRMVRDTFAFIIDNKEAILAVAVGLGTAVGAGRVMTGIGGAAAAAAGGGGRDPWAGAIAKAKFGLTPEGQMAKFAGAVQLATIAAVGFYTVLELGARDIDQAHKREMEGREKAEELRSRLGREAGFAGGKVSAGATLAGLKGMGIDTAALELLSSDKMRAAIIDFNDDVFASKEKYEELPASIRDIVKGMRDSGMGIRGIDNMLNSARNALETAALDEKAKEISEGWQAMIDASTTAAAETAAGAAKLKRFIRPEEEITKLRDEMRTKAFETSKGKFLEREALKGLTPRERRLLGKGPKMKINVTIIQDFKANANPDRIKVATIKALEKVSRTRTMPRTAPGVG